MKLFDPHLDRAEKIQIGISHFLRLTLIIAAGEAAYLHNWLALFVSLIVLALTFLPALITKNFNIHLPVELEFVMVAFIYASLFLGEVRGFYTRFWWWDVVLHASSGIVIGFVGFLILYVLYGSNKVSAQPAWIAVFSFSFAMAIGALWEIFEFTVDSTLGTNMQKTGLVDTMRDLIVDAAGALLASVVGYVYLKKGSSGIVNRILRSFFAGNPQFTRNP
jgi:hypothetical protein